MGFELIWVRFPMRTVAVTALNEEISSPWICALVETAAAKTSRCHSYSVFSTDSRPAFDMQGVSSGEML